MNNLLEIRDLGIDIRGVEILSDIDLSLPPGGSLGIVGETGSGKSMTCRALVGSLGRVRATVKRGKVTFDGIALVDLDERGWAHLRGSRIGFVPQASLSGLDPIMRIGRQLERAVRRLQPRCDPKTRAIELLDLVGLPRPAELLREYPHKLSGGMRQRVMIALALAGAPDLLIADEPTTALDVTVQRGILELLNQLRAERGMALILVTHDLAVAESVTTDIAVMYAGRVIERGPTADVLLRPAHPYTAALKAAQPGSTARGRRLAAVPGGAPSADARPPGCPFAPRCAHAEAACITAVPPLRAIEPGRYTACWRAEELFL